MNAHLSDKSNQAQYISIRCQPDWEALSTQLQSRAKQLQVDLPEQWQPNRLSKYFSLLLLGEHRMHSDENNYTWVVRSMQPETDIAIQDPFSDLSHLHVSFGIKKNLSKTSAWQGMELIWKKDGLFFASWQDVPQQQVYTIPLDSFVNLITREYNRQFSFRIKQHVDVSQHFYSPDELVDWKLSRWRGDRSIHAITKIVRLEILAKATNN